jgi:hypothetical protein
LLPHVFLCDDFLLAQVWKGAEEQRNWRKRRRGDRPSMNFNSNPIKVDSQFQFSRRGKELL